MDMQYLYEMGEPFIEGENILKGMRVAMTLGIIPESLKNMNIDDAFIVLDFARELQFAKDFLLVYQSDFVSKNFARAKKISRRPTISMKAVGGMSIHKLPSFLNGKLICANKNDYGKWLDGYVRKGNMQHNFMVTLLKERLIIFLLQKRTLKCNLYLEQIL